MFRIVGKIIDNELNKNLVGYRLCDDRTGAIGSYTLQEAFKALSLNTVGIRPTSNAQDRMKTCEFPDPYVVYTDGAETKLPVFTANGACIRNSGKIIVLSMFIQNNITYYNVVKAGKPMTMTKEDVLKEYKVSTQSDDGQTPFYNITVDLDKGIIKSRIAEQAIPDISETMNKNLSSAMSVDVPKTTIKAEPEADEYEVPKNFEEDEKFESIEEPKVTKSMPIDDEYSIKNPVIDVHYVGLVQHIVDSMRLSRKKYLGDCSYWKRYTNEQFDAMASFLRMFPFTPVEIEKPYNIDGADFEDYSERAREYVEDFEKQSYGYEFEHKDYIDYARICFLTRLCSKLFYYSRYHEGILATPRLAWFCKHYKSRDTSNELNSVFRNFGIFIREAVMLTMPELMPNIVAILTCTNNTLTITDKIQGAILYVISCIVNMMAINGFEKYNIKEGTTYIGLSYYVAYDNSVSIYSSLRGYADMREYKRVLSNYKFKPMLFDKNLKAVSAAYTLCYVAICAGIDISNAGHPAKYMESVKNGLKKGTLIPMAKNERIFLSIYDKYNPVDSKTPYSSYEYFASNKSFYEFMGLTLDSSSTNKPWFIENYDYTKYNRDLTTSFPNVISNNEQLKELTMQYIVGQKLTYLNYWHFRRILAYIFNFDATSHSLDDYSVFYDKFYKYAHKYGLRRLSDASYCIFAATTLREGANMLAKHPDAVGDNEYIHLPKPYEFEYWNYIRGKGEYEYLDDVATFAASFSIYMGKFKELDIYLSSIRAHVSKKYKDRIDLVMSMLNTPFGNMTFKTAELNSCRNMIMQDESTFAADYNKYMLLAFHKRSYNRYYGFPKARGRLRKFEYGEEYGIVAAENKSEEKHLSNVTLTPLVQLALTEQAAIMGY